MTAKERYFTARNLTPTAARLRSRACTTAATASPHHVQTIGRRRRSRAFAVRGFDIARAALLVLDMQRYFLDAESHACVPSAAAIIPAVADLVQALAAAGRPVVLTRHLNTPADAGMMGRWWRDMLTPEHPLSTLTQTMATLAGCPNTTLVTKTQYDAFYHTDLEQTLRHAGAEQLIITGVMANLCCAATAGSAFVRGFEVFFPADGVAAYNAALHEATLRNVAAGFGRVVMMAQLRAAVEEAAHG